MNTRPERQIIIGLGILLIACSCGGSETGSDSVTLVLGAYTTPREVYKKEIIPGFQRYWKERTGTDVVFRESYLGSGAQARAVIGGFEADIVALSLAADIEKIAGAGLITHEWHEKPHSGMVSTSIVVMAVRPGNPKGISDWQSLTAPGLNVLTPDPRTSGGAMWNICAMYGAALRGFAGVPEDSPAAAGKFLTGVFKNVSVMDKGARESITNFERGIGDVALTYENEVLVGRQAGHKYEYVIPRSTILIQNPAAVVDRYAEQHAVREVAEAFLEYLWSAESQRAYARYGLRPVLPEIGREVNGDYPDVEDLWEIGYLGGWPAVTTEIFGPDGIYTKAYQPLHGSPQ